MKKFLKIAITLALLAVIVFGYQFGAVLNDKNELQNKVQKNSSHLDSLNQQLLVYQKRAQADELFIAGDYEAAMDSYREILDFISEADFVSKRDNAMRHANELMQQLKEKDIDGYNRLKEIRENLNTEVAKTQEYYEYKVDSLRQRYAEEVNGLKDRLNKAEDQIKQNPSIKELNFYSRNGTKTTYFGAVANGKANGEGMGYYSTGNVYIGPWKDNLRHGADGEFKWISGERYEGDYVRDKRSGKGTYFFTNGDRYEGEWADDKQNGVGTLYDRDKVVKLKGKWKDGDFVSEISGQ